MASSAPLPPGWEARWDPNQRAFFYIDHSTKKTSWQDPRIGYHQPPAQQYGGYGHGMQQQHHQQAAQPMPAMPPMPPQPLPTMPMPPQSLNQSTFPFSGKGQGIAMTTKYKQFGSTITNSDGDSDDDFESYIGHPFSQYSDEPKLDREKLMNLKQRFPDADEDTLKNVLQQKHNDLVKSSNTLAAMGFRERVVAQHPPPKVDDIRQRLVAMYPTAPPLVVDKVFASADNEAEARTMLEAMGYSATYPATHRSQTPSRQTSPTKTSSSSRQTSPARRSPTPAQSPAKPKMTEAEKSRMENKIHGQFPSYDMSVIKMALKVCEYKEDRVKAVLERIGGTALSDGRKAPPSRPGTSQSRHRSPSPKPLSPSALEPISILDDTLSTGTRSGPTASTSGSAYGTRSLSPSKKSSSSSSRPTSSKTSVGTRSTTPKKTTTSPPKHHQKRKQQARAKTVTEMSKTVLSSTIDTLNSITNNVACCGARHLPPADSANQSSDRPASSQSPAASQSHDTTEQDRRQRVVSRQPQIAEYKSEYRTEPKGPDPTLCAGPNRELLLSEYTQARGPNPEMRQGPDPNRVQGSQGAVGPDRSLRCGPEQNFHAGPMQPSVLVTAI